MVKRALAAWLAAAIGSAAVAQPEEPPPPRVSVAEAIETAESPPAPPLYPEGVPIHQQPGPAVIQDLSFLSEVLNQQGIDLSNYGRDAEARIDQGMVELRSWEGLMREVDPEAAADAREQWGSIQRRRVSDEPFFLGPEIGYDGRPRSRWSGVPLFQIPIWPAPPEPVLEPEAEVQP
jgi:hypothetical protein